MFDYFGAVVAFFLHSECFITNTSNKKLKIGNGDLLTIELSLMFIVFFFLFFNFHSDLSGIIEENCNESYGWAFAFSESILLCWNININAFLALVFLHFSFFSCVFLLHYFCVVFLVCSKTSQYNITRITSMSSRIVVFSFTWHDLTTENRSFPKLEHEI